MKISHLAWPGFWCGHRSAPASAKPENSAVEKSCWWSKIGRLWWWSHSLSDSTDPRHPPHGAMLPHGRAASTTGTRKNPWDLSNYNCFEPLGWVSQFMCPGEWFHVASWLNLLEVRTEMTLHGDSLQSNINLYWSRTLHPLVGDEIMLLKLAAGRREPGHQMSKDHSRRAWLWSSMAANGKSITASSCSLA